MKLELFYAPGCEKCAANRAQLQQAARQVDAALEWRELDVLEHMDYAVELGVLTLPALAIDGSLAFAALPTPKQLAEAMTRRAQEQL